MDRQPLIDTTFNFETDSGGKDPDRHSPTLRRYHRLLWSKQLPSGAMFDLDAMLRHVSDLGVYWLSSDAITHTFSRWSRPAKLVDVIAQIPKADIDSFYNLGCTIGAYVVFPNASKVDDKQQWTINQARGINARIKDRFDLTLECIRRHYAGVTSPLAANLGLHETFFSLFGDFRGYVDYFLLNDLVSDDYMSIRFHKEFDDFQGTPLPMASVDEYRTYMTRTMDFVRARNDRIATAAAAFRTYSIQQPLYRRAVMPDPNSNSSGTPFPEQ